LPNFPNTADTLGWAYYHNGAYSLVAPLLQEAVKKVPDDQGYRYHLGLTYQKLHDSQAAKAEFERAILLDPNSPTASQARRALSATGGS
jgi:tetratricopeptide (TPR) repeat protein